MDELSMVPRRGTEAYYRRVYRAAEQETLEATTDLLHHLWEDYGLPSTLDVMTEWVCAIDYIMPTHPKAGYRDFTGTVMTSKWASEKYLTEDAMITTAIYVGAEREEEEGLDAHASFASALAITERLRENVFAWKPVITQALRTAHATHHRDPVRAVLASGPGVRERNWVSLRDGASYLYQLANWPMTAARKLGKPMRPPEMDWLANDLSIPPNMIMSMLPPGELSGDC